jgi:Tfp pilus assembly protein PilV
MLRGFWSRFRHEEDGMSVLEIVLAAFILFFVFTAMIGLVGATTRMGVNAKARVAMTNAVSSHMEWVRSLEFEDVDIQPEGEIHPVMTVPVDEFTVTIENQVSDGQDGTKELRVIATASAPGFNGASMTSFAAIRDESGLSLITFEDDDANAPTIEFTNMTPDADEVLYRSYIHGGAPLYIEARAEAVADGAHIAELRYFCQGELLRNGSTIFADVAEWTPGETPATELFRWDTTQVDEGGAPILDDGWRLVYVIATDSQGHEGRAERRFYVDNYAPDPPGAMVAEVQDDVETRLSWGVAQDGTDAAVKYEVQTARFNMAGNLVDVSESIVPDPAYIHQAAVPFSRFGAGVKAGSPRNLWSSPVLLGQPFTTRPRAEGYSTTWYEGRNNRRESFTDVSISASTPNFGTSAITYDVYRSMDPGNMGGAPYATDTGPSFYEQINKAVGKRGTPDPFYYQFKATFTAMGSGGGQPEETWSDVIGPITANEATEDMVHVTW